MIQVLKQTQAKKLIPESIISFGGRHGYTRVYNSTMEISNLDSNTEVRHSSQNIGSLDDN